MVVVVAVDVVEAGFEEGGRQNGGGGVREGWVRGLGIGINGEFGGIGVVAGIDDWREGEGMVGGDVVVLVCGLFLGFMGVLVASPSAVACV